MSRQKNHTFKIMLLLLMFSVSTGYAQRKKDKGLTNKLKLEAEFYFTEGQKYYILEDYAKALVLFQKSLDINDQNATVYYKMAQIKSKGDELDKAHAHIKKAIALDDNNKYFYLLSADIATQMGEFDKAAEVYETMIGKIDKTEQYLFELAAVYLYQNRLDDALSTYDRVEDFYGVSEEVIFQKQKIHLKSNDIEKALKEGEKLIMAFPGEEVYVLKQAELLITNDKEQQASGFLTKHLDSYPESPRSRLILSELKRKDGDIAGATQNLKIAFADESVPVESKVQLLAEYRQDLSKDELKNLGLPLAETLVKAHPDVADSYSVYGDILQVIGDSNGAKNQYVKSLEINEANFGTWQNVLQIMLSGNELDSLMIYSEKALTLFPNQSSLYYFNGVSNLYKQNYQEAISALEQAKRLSSANLGLLSVLNTELGTAYNSIKEYSKSDKAFEAALDFDDSNYIVLNNYSYYLSIRGEKLEKAEKMSEKAVKNNPENLAFIDTYAWILFKMKKYKEAKKVMSKAFEKEGKSSAVYHDHYGDILFKLGNIDEAVEHWQIAQDLDPTELIDKKIAERKLFE